ncbi:hypothetical protein Dvar_12730 [Desulfosarcina variabilis str. Montpellier]|uniref:SPFH domain-containing protein n=1 Tax=Desulfosarcina variabilis TaxID=2300 RepID=UPI003AFB4BAD
MPTFEIIIIVTAGFIAVLASVRITRQYGRAVVFRFGRLAGMKGPGLFLIIPLVDHIVRVDLRVRQLDVPKQTIITRDKISTDPSGSPHAQLIDVCGGINVADCQLASGSGQTPVTMESVLMWRPEVIIITTSQAFAGHAPGDASWKKTPAVQHRRVHLPPGQPFNWFDCPPGVNRIVGIPWTAHVLYPDLFPRAWLENKVKTFYALYYHYDLSNQELEALLSGQP